MTLNSMEKMSSERVAKRVVKKEKDMHRLVEDLLELTS
jgi:hypothetical protein